jgi:hypothetical protein
MLLVFLRVENRLWVVEVVCVIKLGRHCY